MVSAWVGAYAKEGERAHLTPGIVPEASIDQPGSRLSVASQIDGSADL